MVDVVYTVKIKKGSLDEILEIIRHHEFTPKETKPANGTDIPIDNNTTIICNKKFHTEDLGHALELFHVLKGMTDAVTQVTPMFIVKKSRGHLVAIPISTAITFLSLLAVVYQIKPDSTITDVFLIAGIPAIITGASQILYKVFKWF